MAKTKKEYTVVKKKSGRYAVKNAKGAYINGDDKVTILVKEGLVKAVEPKKEAEAEAAE